jgi:hypothetical protein
MNVYLLSMISCNEYSMIDASWMSRAKLNLSSRNFIERQNIGPSPCAATEQK